MSTTPYERPPFDPPRLNKSLAIPLLILIVLLVVASQSVGFYVDKLWFGGLGYESVFWYRLKAESTTFISFFAVSTFLLWALFSAVTPPRNAARRPFIEIGRTKIFTPTLPDLRSLTRPVAALLGIFIGIVFTQDWTAYALLINRAGPAGPVEPIFNKPLSFYLFTLPVLNSLAAWLLAIAAAVMIAAIILSVTDMSAQFRGISTALAFLLLVIAFQTFLARYQLVQEDHSLFSGISYVGDKILAPGYWLTTVALVLGAAVAAFNIASGKIRNLIVAIAIPGVTYGVVGVLIPAYVTNFIVHPNELVRETPYIKANIDFTRKAFALDRVEDIAFEPRLTNATFDPNTHKGTIDNIRLWDWRALQDTLRQVQELRTYYDFPDVDVERYTINGESTEVMVAARELSLDKLPSGTTNWVNERLIYTHGYGLTMNPVSQFTREGMPKFILSNMPVESTVPSIQVKRPEVYFGELTNWPVYVKTHQKEFNFAEGDANNYTTYEGSGGIPMSSLIRRLLVSFEVGDITKVPFSDDITSTSALLLHRNIADRASTLAPFLTFDPDPYIVVGDDGKLYWIMDAFTSSDQYPESRHVTVGDDNIDYMRNSVKVVIDAYTGETSFYIFDASDPIIESYQKMFPALFKPASAMPDFLHKHVRYPQMLLQVQAELYTAYHVENPEVFYNREDIWTIAQQGRSQGGQQTSDTLEPSYVLMNFPGEQKLEFVSILPFTPANRTNLIGWIAGRSDGDEYGKIRAYHFPKTHFIDGPQQVQARIDQDPQLSSQLTLWNQQGSKVIRGNLLVLPLDDILLFAEPIYLQAERSPMPELRLVVLATQDRLAYAPTFDESLKLLLSGGGGTLTSAAESPGSNAPETNNNAAPAATPAAAPATNPANAAADVRSLVERANQALADYRKLTSEGKLGEAGAKLDELNHTLEEMKRTAPQKP